MFGKVFQVHGLTEWHSWLSVYSLIGTQFRGYFNLQFWRDSILTGCYFRDISILNFTIFLKKSEHLQKM